MTEKKEERVVVGTALNLGDAALVAMKLTQVLHEIVKDAPKEIRQQVFLTTVAGVGLVYERGLRKAKLASPEVEAAFREWVKKGNAILEAEEKKVPAELRAALAKLAKVLGEVGAEEGEVVKEGPALVPTQKKAAA